MFSAWSSVRLTAEGCRYRFKWPTHLCDLEELKARWDGMLGAWTPQAAEHILCRALAGIDSVARA
jgi:hypothetical protein